MQTCLLQTLQVAEPKELLTCLQHLFCDQELSLDLSLDDALALFTSNPARRLKLPPKGQVRVVIVQPANEAELLSTGTYSTCRTSAACSDASTVKYNCLLA